MVGQYSLDMLEDLSNTKFYQKSTKIDKTTLRTYRFQKNQTILHKFYMNINPKYAWSPKNHTLLDQFYKNLIPYAYYARTVLNCEKRALFTWIFGRAWYPLLSSSAPQVLS